MAATFSSFMVLTHQAEWLKTVTANLAIIGSDKGLWPIRRRVII